MLASQPLEKPSEPEEHCISRRQAPAQGGPHYNGRKTFGHSMIVSPDGKILKELNKSEGVITASIDPKLSKKLRSVIPTLKLD